VPKVEPNPAHPRAAAVLILAEVLIRVAVLKRALASQPSSAACQVPLPLLHAAAEALASADLKPYFL